MSMPKSTPNQLRVRYVYGFALSLLMTFVAYVLVTDELLTMNALLIALSVLALVQTLIQLYYFLHISEDTKPRYRLMTFGFMALVLLIIVAGSLWIMYHLNYNMMQMSPSEKNQYMITQHDKGF